RRHTRSKRDWSSDVCSSDLASFDVVCANLKLTYGDRPPWLKNYQIRTTPNGTRIGLFGLTARFNPYYHLLGWDAKEIEKVVADRSEERRVGKECGGGGVWEE